MRTTNSLALTVLLAAGVGGCCSNECRVRNDVPDQLFKRPNGMTVITLLDRRFDLERTRAPFSDYSVLVGAYGSGGAREGRALFDFFDAPGYDGTKDHPATPTPKGDPADKKAAYAVTGAATDETPGAAAVELLSGWVYVVRPPSWPIVRTPRIRGGVPLSSTCPATQVYVAAYADGQVERIFYLGATDAAGAPVSCTFRVEADGVEATGAVDLTIGQYAEVTLTGGSPFPWGTVTVGVQTVNNNAAGGDIGAFMKYAKGRVQNAGMSWNQNVALP